MKKPRNTSLANHFFKSARYLVATVTLSSGLYAGGCVSQETRSINMLEEAIRYDDPERRQRALKLLAETTESMDDNILINTHPESKPKLRLHQAYEAGGGFKETLAGNNTILYYGIKNLLPSEFETALESTLSSIGLDKQLSIPKNDLVSIISGTNQARVTLPNYESATSENAITIDQTKEQILEIDQLKPQIALSVLVAEVSREDSLDIRMILQGLYDKNPDYTTTLESKLHGKSDIQLAQLGGIGGTSMAYITEGLGYLFKVMIEMLDTRGRAFTLNDSALRTSSGARVTSSKTEEEPIPKVIFGTQVTEAAFEYEEAISTIAITPYAMDDGRVMLEDLQIDVAAFGKAEQVPPKLQKNLKLDEIVLSRDEALFITGLRERSEFEVRRQVPVFSGIPLIGEIFKGRNVEKSDTETYILIIPHVYYPNIINGQPKNREETQNQ